MEEVTVMKTRRLNLCVSCEICRAVCPKGAITMVYKFGQFLPKVNEEKCTNCGLCLELCPGIDVDSLGLRYKDISNDILNGLCLESYTAYSNDPEIRKNSASGGLITNLTVELIKNNEFDAAFVLPFDTFAGTPVRLKLTNNINEILNAAKSKYVPASVYEVIRTLKKRDSRKYIIIGTPCQIYGIKKFIKKRNISEEGLLFLGLFCEKTLNFNTIRYFKDSYGKPNEKLTKFEFRTKEEYGWPGNSKLCFDSGREIIVDRTVRTQSKRFFQLNRCLFCLDKLNKLADISFGDCYIEGKRSFDGKSSVIIRTEKGKKIFNKYSYLFSLEIEDIKKIRDSQHLMEKKDNLQYAKVLIKENNLYSGTISDYEIDSQASRGLSKSQKYIRWGRKYDINKIKTALFLSKVRCKSEAIYRYVGRRLIVAVVALESFLIHIYGKKRRVLRKTKGANIIIIGGNLFNKGAQAMTFTVVDQAKRRFPNRSVYLFSTLDFERGDKEKSAYSFNILPCDLKTKMRLLGFGNRLFIKNTKYWHLEDELRKVITDAVFFIDISGYALSSQWELFSSIGYLLNIIIAKKFSITYYIFPQSIGPFDYPVKHKIFLYPLMRLFLAYPRKIFPREKEGVQCVNKFSKKNVQKNHDIVLQNKELNLSNIYIGDVHFKYIKIEPNSVGIIPNLRVVERANPDEIYPIYISLIYRLANAQKTVYILRHSYEDLEICEKIKTFFPSNESVKLISDDLNAVQLENIIKQFDFVIASRYHSIVHAYKNGVPALVIGWATKYFELLDDFGQLEYFSDCRGSVDIDEIGNKLDKMIRSYKCEREKIINKMNILINKESPFDMLFAPGK